MVRAETSAKCGVRHQFQARILQLGAAPSLRMRNSLSFHTASARNGHGGSRSATRVVARRVRSLGYLNDRKSTQPCRRPTNPLRSLDGDTGRPSLTSWTTAKDAPETLAGYPLSGSNRPADVDPRAAERHDLVPTASEAGAGVTGRISFQAIDRNRGLLNGHQ